MVFLLEKNKEIIAPKNNITGNIQGPLKKNKDKHKDTKNIIIDMPVLSNENIA